MSVAVAVRLALPLGLAALLAACGPVKRINPPAATVQRLAVEGEAVVLELRVQNHSDVSTRVARFDGTIALDGGSPLPLALAIDLDVPPHAAEVVAARVGAAGLATTPERTLRYRLEGRIETREPRGDYPIEYESRLSPVPGRPGEFR